MTLQAGQYVTDGTAVFILDDIRDGHRVGDIVFRPVLHNGFIKANGSTVKASDYPRLLKFAQDNNLLVASDVWNSNKAMYVYDSNADTLQVPDAQLKVLMGTNSVVTEVKAGLPNIVGTIGITTAWASPSASGVFTIDYFDKNNNVDATNGNKGSCRCEATFNASYGSSIYGYADTVQPPALALIPQIKY